MIEECTLKLDTCEVGVVRERGSNPGMSQLQQRRSPGTEKDDRLPVDSSGYGVRAEEAKARLAGQCFKRGAEIRIQPSVIPGSFWSAQLGFQIQVADQAVQVLWMNAKQSRSLRIAS